MKAGALRGLDGVTDMVVTRYPFRRSSSERDRPLRLWSAYLTGFGAKPPGKRGSVAYVATSPSPSDAAHGAPLLWPGGVSASTAPREDAVVATDAEGVVTAWGAGAERLYGWPSKEAVGRRAGELLRPTVDRASRATAERELRGTRAAVYVGVNEMRPRREARTA